VGGAGGVSSSADHRQESSAQCSHCHMVQAPSAHLHQTLQLPQCARGGAPRQRQCIEQVPGGCGVGDAAEEPGVVHREGLGEGEGRGCIAAMETMHKHTKKAHAVHDDPHHTCWMQNSKNWCHPRNTGRPKPSSVCALVATRYSAAGTWPWWPWQPGRCIGVALGSHWGRIGVALVEYNTLINQTRSKTNPTPPPHPETSSTRRTCHHLKADRHPPLPQHPHKPPQCADSARRVAVDALKVRAQQRGRAGGELVVEGVFGCEALERSRGAVAVTDWWEV